MSTRRRITITLDGRVAIVRGWRAADLIKEAGGKPIYAGTVGGWLINRTRVADLLAYLEQRNIAATVVDKTTLPGGGKRSADASRMVAERFTVNRDVVRGVTKNPARSRKNADDGGLW